MIVAAVFTLGMTSLAIPVFVPGAVRWNSRVLSVDIYSGALRQDVYLFGACVKSRVIDTAVSRVAAETHNAPGGEVWMRAISSPLGIPFSPHYSFHEVPYAIQQLADCFQSGRLDAAAQQATVRYFLSELRSPKGPYQATEFANEVWRLAQGDAHQHVEITIGEIELVHSKLRD